MPDINLDSLELEKKVTLAEAYLVMFEFLETNWNGCWNTELGSVMSELSLWQNSEGRKRPIDAAVLPTFLKAYQKVASIEDPIKNYAGANVELKK
ncbi:MAG: hypothetical protein AAF402_00805 [Pseudomonadota bacterium]